MANIQSQFNIVHAESGLNLSSALIRVSDSTAFTPLAVTVLNVDETVDLGDITTPMDVIIKFISGDPLLIGFDGANYPMRLTTAKEWQKLRLDVEGLLETSVVTTVADVAGSLQGKFFVLDDVNTETWAIGFGTLTHTEDNEISVTISNDATATQVAAALYAALIANTAFATLFSTAYNGTTGVTITDKHTGTRTGIVDTGTTGFTVTTSQSGAASPVVHLKSVGTTECVTVVAPK